MKVSYRIERCLNHYDSNKWDLFVESSNNGTVFHRQDFLSYHPLDRFRRDDKMIYRNDKLVGVLPLSYERSSTGKIGYSPYGSSYGGLVTRTLSSQEIYSTWEFLLNELRKQDYKIINLVPTPLCYCKVYNINIEYFLLKMVKYKLVDRGISSVVDIDNYRPLSRFKRNVKKSEKFGIRVINSQDIDSFYTILLNTISDRHHSSPTHTLEELKYLKCKLMDNMKIFLGVWKDKPVSGVLTFENTSPCVLAFYNCYLSDYGHLCSLYKVFDYIVQYYRGKKRWLDLGLTDRFTSSYNWGLFQFKEGMGAQGFYRDYYKLIL